MNRDTNGMRWGRLGVSEPHAGAFALSLLNEASGMSVFRSFVMLSHVRGKPSVGRVLTSVLSCEAKLGSWLEWPGGRFREI